jgi:hypothetical protein
LTIKQHKKSYNNNFYAYEGATSIDAAKRIMPLILDFVHPTSIADIGCGTGKFLKEAENIGVSDLLGIDGPWAARTLAEGIPFREMDLSNPTDVGRTFDLAISLEVAEHLPKEAASKFIAFLTSVSPVIMFSAAIPFQGGQMHLNEQWQSYWADLFSKQGYVPIDALRPEIWSDASVLSCYRQNALVYVRKDALPNYPKLQAITVCKNVNLVHPDVYSGILQTYMGYAITLMNFIKKLPKPLRPIARYLPNRNIKKLAAQQSQPETNA